MSGSDGEWYLRRCAEDELLDGRPSVLDARADALVAIGFLPADIARGIVDLYWRARALRGHREESWGQGRPPVTTAMPPPPRISPCGLEIDQPWGTVTVHYVVSNTHQTALSVTIHSSLNPAVQVAGPGSAGGTPTLTVTDDRGRRHRTDFSGVGTDVDWHGSYLISPPLPAGTKWIRVFGQRIELTGAPSDVTVAVKVLDRDDSVHGRAGQHLIRLVETVDRWHRGTDPFPVAVETFVDCGALPASAEVINQAAMFSAALQGTPVPTAQLPPRWRSVIAGRGRRGGPVGIRTVGVTTPVFDRFRVSVHAVRSWDDNFEIDFEANGDVVRSTVSSMATPGFVVEAVDDRQQHYLGESRQSGYGNDVMSGTTAFGGPLDRDATTVDLIFNRTSARAVVTVPLQWEGTQ